MMTEHALDAGPGLWRPGPIWARDDATGQMVYQGPESEEVPGLVEELVAQLKQSDDCPAMVRGAMAHLNLAMIHPFRDGNGRMARCLQTLALARDRILSPEWMSIEEYLGANTEAYYAILAETGKGAWNPDGDARAWVRFCLRAHFLQATSVLRRAREAERIWAAVDDLREERGLPERVVSSLFDATTGLRIRNASHRKAVEMAELEKISNQVATNDLQAMVQAGLIEKRGSKRGTFYVAAPPLIEIQNLVRVAQRPVEAESIFA